MVVVKLRSVVGISMIWLAAVAGVSVTAWVAIDRAGRDITNGAVSSLPPVTVGMALGTATPGDGPTPTDPASVPSATTAPATPAPSRTQVPPASPKPGTPLGSTTPRDRSVSVEGGQVSVRCTGSRIVLRIAQPDDGWRVDVDDAGPQEVRVKFQRGDDDEGGETRVTAVCVTGTPTFKVERHR